MAKKYLIVGNPNTGKTTLFNCLTGSHEKTANYSGVTVAEKKKSIKYNNEEIEFVDLPGIYTLNSSSVDEVVTKNYLSMHKNDSVLFICSSQDIKKNLILLTELAKQGHRLVVLINEVGKKVAQPEIEKAKEILKVPILQADVRKEKDELLNWLSSVLAAKVTQHIDLESIINLFSASPEKLKRLDSILLHKIWGKVIFCCVFVAVLVVSYGRIGNGISLVLEGLLLRFDNFVGMNIKILNLPWLSDFWSKVIIGGVGQVVIYLPQLALMLTILFLLEDVGYLPRVASLFNYRLERFGMNGKSVFSLIMGVGCTTSAILTTRNVGTQKVRIATAKMLPYIGCSAKLPIFMFITQMVLGGKGVIYVGLIYLSAMVIGLSFLSITRKEKTKYDYFIAEIPKLKIPSLKFAIKQSLIIVGGLFKKIVVTVLVSTIVLWLMLNVTPSFNFFTGEKSLLEWVADYIGYAFIPLGLNRSDVIISLISGMVAKENIMSVMGLFGGVNSLTQVQAMTFLIFIMLYAPCVSAIKCTKCEFGGKFALKLTMVQLLIAYVSAFVFNTFAKVSLILGFLSLIVGAVLMIASCKIINQSIYKNRKILTKPV